MSVYVIDEIMGRGKTSAMINHINASGDNERFLFVAPYLTEVDRIKTACVSKNFVSPGEEGGKLKNIKPMLAAKKNIVATHALFNMFDDEILGLIREGGYVLVMDEVASVIEEVDVTPYDAQVIMHEFASSEDGWLTWDKLEYTGKFDEYRELVESRYIYAYSPQHWIRIMPKVLFTSFKDVYVMTYMFQHQYHRCYFDLMNISYERLYVHGDTVQNYCLLTTPNDRSDIDLSPLVHILDNKKLNHIGEDRGALSKSWYLRNNTTPRIEELRRNTYNFFHNYAKTSAGKNMWTTFCDGERFALRWKERISGAGYAKGFLPCNARGTNQFRHKTAAAYLVNRFPSTCTYNFLVSQGVTLDRDKYALSEMLQWIWRTAIRDGKEIYLYIPSRRMRELLIWWLDGGCNEKD